MRPVLTKQDFYRRFYRGEFGNHGPMWEDIDDWRDDGAPGPVMIRCRVPDSPYATMVPRGEVHKEWPKFKRYGPTINLQCPERDKLLTGEVCLSYRGLEFTGSTRLDVDQRRSTKLKDTIRSHGLSATMLVRGAMFPADWEWLQYLLSAYPDHVVEFTSIRYPWGVIPGMNTIIWEVRKY